MKSIEFKEVNITYAKDQPPYKPLPVFKDPEDPSGTTISCWKLTRWERVKLLYTGRLWLCLLTFNKPLTPVRLGVHRKEFLRD